MCERCKQLEILLHPQLRNSRFDFNARYIRFDEAQQIAEFKPITEALATAKNFQPYPVGNFTFYRRGTGGLWLYVVPTCDFRVPRERKSHFGPENTMRTRMAWNLMGKMCECATKTAKSSITKRKEKNQKTNPK